MADNEHTTETAAARTLERLRAQKADDHHFQEEAGDGGQ
jgi:hypothetical protein